MALLTIDLQDGFVGETVAIRIDGRELASVERVQTRPQLGLAHRIERELPPGRHQLDIELPGRALRHTLDVETDAPVFVGVSVAAGALVCKVQEREYWYA
jgi:hypothetical protein